MLRPNPKKFSTLLQFTSLQLNLALVISSILLGNKKSKNNLHSSITSNICRRPSEVCAGTVWRGVLLVDGHWHEDDLRRPPAKLFIMSEYVIIVWRNSKLRRRTRSIFPAVKELWKSMIWRSYLHELVLEHSVLGLKACQ